MTAAVAITISAFCSFILVSRWQFDKKINVRISGHSPHTKLQLQLLHFEVSEHSHAELDQTQRAVFNGYVSACCDLDLDLLTPRPKPVSYTHLTLPTIYSV